MSEVKRFFTAIGHEGTPYVDMIEDDYDEFAADVDLILRKYQQSKEAADEN